LSGGALRSRPPEPPARYAEVNSAALAARYLPPWLDTLTLLVDSAACILIRSPLPS
jgi:hypothetical protein